MTKIVYINGKTVLVEDSLCRDREAQTVRDALTLVFRFMVCSKIPKKKSVGFEYILNEKEVDI